MMEGAKGRRAFLQLVAGALGATVQSVAAAYDRRASVQLVAVDRRATVPSLPSS
jgi:hypothetical protein